MSKVKDDKHEEEVDIIDDVEFAIEAEDASSDDCKKKITKLKKEISRLKEEKQEYLTGWQEARAELVNAKKRMEAEHKERQSWANSRLLEDLLPVADSFGMAMANKEVWESVDKNWRIGIEYIYSQIEKVFSEYGMESINTVNEVFDANLHESVEHQNTKDKSQDGKVAEIKKTGYKLNGKVLRPAKVTVYHYEA